MSTIDHKDIASIYSQMGANFINEKVEDQSLPDDTKSTSKSKKVKGNAGIGNKEKCPTKTDGYKAPEEAEDKYNSSAKVHKESKTNKKVKKDKNFSKEGINSYMSGKSLFDELYEEVMSDDEDILGIGGDDDGEGNFGDEFDSEAGEGEVTLTLPKEVAEQLFDLLAGQLDDTGEEEDDGELDLDGDEMDEDDQFSFGEGVDSETIPEPSKDSDKSRQVVAHKDLVASGDGKQTTTTKVGDDGDHGHAIVNGKHKNSDKARHRVRAKRGVTPGSQAFSK